MTWIAVSDHDGYKFSASGLGRPPDAADLVGRSDDALMCRGSMIIETRLPASRRPRPLVYYDRPGDWPFHLSLQAIPGGGLTMIVNQGGEIRHQTINMTDAGRTDVLRITYSWDSLSGWGRMAIERTDQDQVHLVPVGTPRPLRLEDARAIMGDSVSRYVAPDVLYLALSTEIEPVGPTPSLMPETPIATPQGYRHAGDLRRGDLVLGADGRSVPVLHTISRTVPTLGSFRPVRLRVPYFGLQQDITVAPSQRLVLSGSDVEYLFNQEAVLVEARHLVGGNSVLPVETGPTVTYTQLLLPKHEAVIAAGTVAETLYVGRLRRKKHQLQASILAAVDRNEIPEHARSVHPVLRAFDANVLAEQRAA